MKEERKKKVPKENERRKYQNLGKKEVSKNEGSIKRVKPPFKPLPPRFHAIIIASLTHRRTSLRHKRTS